MLVVSAYVKETDGNPGYISGTIQDPIYYDFGSILKFIESNFGLKTVIPPPNAYADTVANALDPQFYSLGTARTFTPIPAPVPAICFINPNTQNCYLNYTGPTDPDDDASD